MSANSATPPPSRVQLGCSKCGASLPEEAQFCLKCGKPVSSPPKITAVAEVLPPAEPPRPRRKRRVMVWVLLALLVAFILWVLNSDSTLAQEIQEFVGFKQDRVILDNTFSVGPHTFRYYKFSLPEGSVNVAAVGQFKSVAEGPGASRNSASANNEAGDKNKVKDADNNDNNIEAYVLNESAFTVWQNGYATSSLYDSGSVAESAVQADIPAGAGIYYLVFSNKSAPKASKAVHATVMLRYKSWLPDSFRRMKGRISEWFGV